VDKKVKREKALNISIMALNTHEFSGGICGRQLSNNNYKAVNFRCRDVFHTGKRIITHLNGKINNIISELEIKIFCNSPLTYADIHLPKLSFMQYGSAFHYRICICGFVLIYVYVCACTNTLYGIH
jgi:hypothetical protein